MNLSPSHQHGWFPSPNRSQEWLPVPGIERPMVPGLPASGEHQIVTDHVPTTKPIVGVDSGTGPVEKHVAGDQGLGRLALDVKTTLLLIQSDLPGGVAQDGIVPWVIPIGAIHTSLGEVGVRCVVRKARVLRLVRVPPGRNSITPNVGKIRVLHGGVPVVPANHHSITIQTLEHAVLDGRPLGALQEHRANAVQGPVAAGRDAMGVHVGVARGAEGQPIESDVADGVPLGATDVK
mmetsp:Transcript_45306/g.98288  ORF Transcript_45306/g.98288 Transcript_45306/m.98288 type:complete len:235 (+) Transcript_45306:671-1375(+)